MIRKAQIEDANEIAILDESIFEDHLGYDFIYNDIKNNPFARYFVAVEDEKIIGYIGSRVYDNTEILNFCVDSSYRKQGIGQLLISEVIKIASGCISLEVRKSNIPAISLYKKNGFIIALTRRNYYSNGEDALLMIRK